MTVTPFYSADQPDYLGADPGEVQYWPTRPGRFFLGKPERMMVELPSPSADGYTSPMSTGEVEHGGFGGGVGVTRFPNRYRRYTLPYARELAGRDRAIIEAFYKGTAVGPGPWAFVPPEDTNRFTLAQAACGALHGAVEGWFGASLPIYQPNLLGRTFPGGVMLWDPTGANDTLYPSPDGNVDLAHCAPHLPGMPTTAYIWAQTTSGTASLQMRLTGQATTGTVVHAENGLVTTVGTNWTPLVITVDQQVMGPAQILAPQPVSLDGNPVLLCNPRLDYTDNPDLDAWTEGAGVPRVVWPTGLDRALSPHRTVQTTMTLAETVGGAC